MNNIFSLPRFIMLFKKHTIEKGKEYLLSILVLALILIVFLTYMEYVNSSGLKDNLQEVVFVVTFLLSGLIFTSMAFAEFGDKRKSTSYLLLPASHLEKYLVSWIYSFLIFQIAFLIIFYSSTFIVITLNINENGVRNKLFNLFNHQSKPYIIFAIYLFLHSFVFFGAVFYKKKHFIKTVFSLFLVAISITFFNKLFLSLLIKTQVITAPPFTNLRFIEGEKYYTIKYEQNDYLIWILVITTVLILWLSAYYRLKEKEV